MPKDADRLFCSKPFDYLEPGVGGDAFLCCPSWLPRSIGNAARKDPAALWNGRRAQEIRASILDGSFRHCTDKCPHLVSRNGPVKRAADVTDPEHRRIIDEGLTELPRGPRSLVCSYDRSCNLACPTCRPEVLQASKTERARLAQMQDRLLEAFGPDLHKLYVTGSGDPFGSPLFFDLLRNVDPKRHPDLGVQLHTNAQLFTKERWQALANIHGIVDFVEVSIDAATAATYHVNRAPGRWDRLLENLAFIAGLRRDGLLRRLNFSFVVQANNWREMPAFVALARRFSADGVYFGELVHWWFPRRVLGVSIGKVPVMAQADFEAAAVQLPGHAEHDEFVGSLGDPVFDEPGVNLGALARLRPRRAASGA